MYCIDCTIQALLLDVVSSQFFASVMIRLIGLYKYAGYVT